MELQSGSILGSPSRAGPQTFFFNGGHVEIKNLKVKNKEFTAYLIIDSEERPISGEFYVRFRSSKDQYPEVCIEGVYLDGSFQDADIKDILDLDHLAQQILDTDDGTWYLDYMDYLAEQRWERMGDR